jgi:hypothetical protein
MESIDFLAMGLGNSRRSGRGDMSPEAIDRPETGDDHVSEIMVRLVTASEPTRLAWAIRAARAWLGPEVEPAPAGLRRHEADLRLRVSDQPSLVTFGKAAYVDIGPVRPLEEGWDVEIGWRASTLAPLFPVFSGTLRARGPELTLSGWYAPPGGALGRAADRALLHVAAKATGRWLLRAIDNAAAQAAG